MGKKDAVAKELAKQARKQRKALRRQAKRMEAANIRASARARAAITNIRVRRPAPNPIVKPAPAAKPVAIAALARRNLPSAVPTPVKAVKLTPTQSASPNSQAKAPERTTQPAAAPASAKVGGGAARAEELDLRGLKKLTAVKNLLLGDRSKGVMLLEGGVVAKTYDRRSRSQVARFDKEVAVLRELEGCPYVPKLYKVDEDSKTIFMEYVGKNSRLTYDQQQAVNRALRHIGEKYHVFRVKRGKACFTHADLFPANICVDNNGNIKLIDFGSSLWQIHRRSFQTFLNHA
jgi:serine/threonine protein kinase